MRKLLKWALANILAEIWLGAGANRLALGRVAEIYLYEVLYVVQYSGPHKDQTYGHSYRGSRLHCSIPRGTRIVASGNMCERPEYLVQLY